AASLLVCAPWTWLARAGGEGERPAPQVSAPDAAAVGTSAPLEGAARLFAMLLFSLIVAASAVVFGAMAVHLVAMLEASRLAAGVAVAIASLKGIAQVVGRIWDLTLARQWHPIDVG